LRETEVDDVLHLHLVERRLDHLDRILDGAHIDRRRGELLQRRIERRGLAGTGRAGHQDDAVRPFRHVLPARLVIVGEAEIGETADQHFRVENPHHQLLAEGGGQRRQTQFGFLTLAVRVLMRPSCGRASRPRPCGRES
jgi:hypothetical protein